MAEATLHNFEIRIAFFVVDPHRMFVFATLVDELPPVGSEVVLRDPRFPRFPVEEHGTLDDGEIGFAQTYLGTPEVVARLGGPEGLREAMEAEGYELVSEHDIAEEEQTDAGQTNHDDRIPGPFTASEWTPLGSRGRAGPPTPQPHAIVSCLVGDVPSFDGRLHPIAPIAIQFGTATHYLSARMTRAAARELAERLLAAVG